MIQTDIQKSFDTIRAKFIPLTNLMRYYDGPQPLRYSTERIKDAFADIHTHFEINWCTVIVDATLDRMILSGFNIKNNSAANNIIDEIFERSNLTVDAQNVHKSALTSTLAYLIVWKTDEQVDVYFNDPRMCHMFYDSTRPKIKKYAAKWFELDDGRWEMTLYYPARIEHWQTTSQKAPDNYKSLTLVSEEINQYGIIPVFEFFCDGEIAKVVTLQDAINKIFADMMVAGEFGAFVQRWVISQADPGDLKNGANVVWWLPSGDGQGQQSSVGQFTATPMTPYLDAMDKLATAMAIITRTPKHYLMSTGSNISGEALLAMESPLVKKVKQRQKIFEGVWQEVAKFILQLSGYVIDQNDIVVTWERPEALQPFTEAQTRQLAINSGIPLETSLRRDGWSEQELSQLRNDIKNAKEIQSSVAQAVLDKLRIQQEQQNAKNQDMQINDTTNPQPTVR